jgi:protein TorT
VLLLASTRRLALFLVLLSLAGGSHAWTVQSRQPLFQFSQWREATITPLTAASRPWRLCTLYPHIKDSYWLSVNYGMVDQARQLGIHLRVAEAGGYHRLERQWQQVEACLHWGADAILLGTVAYDEISDRLRVTGSATPLFGLVNDLSKEGLVARVGVSWYRMGYEAGAFLARRHPKGSPPVRIAWFPGPTKLEVQSRVGQGLLDALRSGAVAEVITAGHGDNDREVQRTLLQELLDRQPDLDYIVGGAVLAEVAVNELNKRKLEKRPQIVSHYYSHGMYRALLRGRVLMANTDQMVLHGRLAVDQAVRYLEGLPFERDIGPAIVSLTRQSLNPEIKRDSLSPAGFRPTYLVEPTGE